MSGFDILGPVSPVKPYGIDHYGKDNLVPKGGDVVAGEGSESFVSDLNDALSEIRSLQLDVREQVRGLASGEPVEVHDLMISMGRSEIAFNLMLEVRNKLLEAWQMLQRSVS